MHAGCLIQVSYINTTYISSKREHGKAGQDACPQALASMMRDSDMLEEQHQVLAL